MRTRGGRALECGIWTWRLIGKASHDGLYDTATLRDSNSAIWIGPHTYALDPWPQTPKCYKEAGQALQTYCICAPSIFPPTSILPSRCGTCCPKSNWEPGGLSSTAVNDRLNAFARRDADATSIYRTRNKCSAVIDRQLYGSCLSVRRHGQDVRLVLSLTCETHSGRRDCQTSSAIPQ